MPSITTREQQDLNPCQQQPEFSYILGQIGIMTFGPYDTVYIFIFGAKYWNLKKIKVRRPRSLHILIWKQFFEKPSKYAWSSGLSFD